MAPRRRRRAASPRHPRPTRARGGVSLIIRAFNEEEHIARLLTGVLQQTVQPREILLIDSGSTDATLSIARRFPVRVLRLDRARFSFGRSLNLGCRAARGEFLVFASAHVYPLYRDWLEKLLAPFRESRVALVYGRQKGDSKTRFSEQQVFAQWYPEVSTPRQETPFCNNANAAIRRSLWRLHPYEEELPALEDLEWAMWALASGQHLAYAAEAEVAHVHRETPSQVFNRYRREAMALKRLRPELHFGIPEFVRLVASSSLRDARQAWRQGRFLGVFREIAWFRFLQYWGTYQGFRLSGPLTDQLKRTFYYPESVTDRVSAVPRRARRVEYGAILSPPRGRGSRR
ncbi:MAG: glycosyltransferase family 2 protein [Anaerolineales bacterium]